MHFGYTAPDGSMLNFDYDVMEFDISKENNARKLHNISGKLFLEPQEKILYTLQGVFKLSDQWRTYGYNNIFELSGGDAIFYLTNLRLIALRTPDSAGEAMSGLTLLGIPHALGTYLEGKYREKIGFRQFMELPINEIIAVHLSYKHLHILSNLQTFRCTIPSNLTKVIIDILQPKEVIKIQKGIEKINKEEIIYYVDPKELKKETLYEKRKYIIQKAVKYEKKGKKMKAMKMYQKALQLFPDDKLSQRKIDLLSGKIMGKGLEIASEDGDTNTIAEISYYFEEDK